MKLARRTELLTGACAFTLLGGAFLWQAASYWRNEPVGLQLLGELGPPWSYVAAAWFAALGGATVVATLLFVRVRWTPPLPGAPVGSADGAGAAPHR
jgi:hypothetical protein